ncbi:class I SAM-dependent methyltransferase, partial [Campylobacter coli]
MKKILTLLFISGFFSVIFAAEATIPTVNLSLSAPDTPIASLRKDLKLFGADNAPSMLEIAKSKAQAYGLNIEFFEANLC